MEPPVFLGGLICHLLQEARDFPAQQMTGIWCEQEAKNRDQIHVTHIEDPAESPSAFAAHPGQVGYNNDNLNY